MKWMIQWAVTSSVLILIVLGLRWLLRDKLSARWRYALWAVVLVRLLVPVQVELPAAASQAMPLLVSNVAPEIGEERSVPVFPQSRRPVAEYNGITFDLLEPGEIMPTETSMGYYQRSQDGETVIRYLDVWSPAQIVGAVWGVGAALMTLVLLVSNLCFALRLWWRREPLEDMDAPVPVYAAEGLPSPCLFGVFRPAIYLTPGAAENPDTLRHVLAHELTHYTHKDHIWSLLRCLALALHWYNPLVWLAVVLSKRDGELACDEGAVARLGEEERIPYGRTLVDMVAQRSLRPADLLSCSTAMTGGGKSIQQRVTRLVKHPKTVKTALFTAAAVVAVSAVFVFAERSDVPANSEELDAFLSQTQAAQSIFVGNPLVSSQLSPPAISDPAALAQAKDILSKPIPVVKEDDRWTVMSLSSDSAKHPEPITQEELERQFISGGYRLNLYPTAEQNPDTADRYILIPWDGYCLLTQWYPEREENMLEVVAALHGDTVAQLKKLAEAYVPDGGEEKIPGTSGIEYLPEEGDRQHTPAEPDTSTGQDDGGQQNSDRYRVDIEENPEALEALIQLFISDEDFLAQNARAQNTTPEDIAAWLKGEGREPIPPEILIISPDSWTMSAFGDGSLLFIGLTIPDHLTAPIQDICQSFGVEISW